jgi:hypothetical protein
LSCSHHHLSHFTTIHVNPAAHHQQLQRACDAAGVSVEAIAQVTLATTEFTAADLLCFLADAIQPAEKDRRRHDVRVRAEEGFAAEVCAGRGCGGA